MPSPTMTLATKEASKPVWAAISSTVDRPSSHVKTSSKLAGKFISGWTR
jgi:hypothetical protein